MTPSMQIYELQHLRDYREAFQDGLRAGATEASRWRDLSVEPPPLNERLTLLGDGDRITIAIITTHDAVQQWQDDGWKSWRKV